MSTDTDALAFVESEVQKSGRTTTREGSEEVAHGNIDITMPPEDMQGKFLISLFSIIYYYLNIFFHVLKFIEK